MPCSKDWLYTFVNALYIYSQAYLTHLIGVPIVDLFPFKITIKSRTSYSCMGEKKKLFENVPRMYLDGSEFL